MISFKNPVAASAQGGLGDGIIHFLSFTNESDQKSQRCTFFAIDFGSGIPKHRNTGVTNMPVGTEKSDFFFVFSDMSNCFDCNGE
ncbi:hypothetical protein BB561_002410 [Smittium simulii]|uniref:Uncharacterized protein n=1 Tax=Smittium simulii TaxID=133385 RepID=A0A2T9YQH3_9FUNG|nr:hypothetical protein BB561_002410 [Smittium simulii]